MEVGSSRLRSEELQRNIHITVQLRALIGSIKGDVALKERLESNLPQAIAIGPQSAGKSSLFEQLLKIRFPQAAGTMCTRVRCEFISLRGPKQPIQVSLKGPNDFVQVFSDDDVAKNIDDAQKRAVELAKKPISREYHIEVKCQDETRVNFAMNDFPGFFSPNDPSEVEIANDVAAMGKEFANMPNSLVLHVMNIDQDHANISTKLVISELEASKVINVFTMPDLLKKKENAHTQLMDYVEKTSFPRFAVYGKHAGNREHEVEFLQNLSLFDESMGIQLGVEALGTYLEERISDHLARLLPLFRADILDELSNVQYALQTTWKPINQAEIAHQIAMDISMKMPWNEFDRDLRRAIGRLREGVRKQRIRPLGQTQRLFYRVASKDELEIDDEVFIQTPKDQESASEDPSSEEEQLERAPFTAAVVESVGETYVLLKGGKEASYSRVHVLDLSQTLLEEVMTMMDERGLVNTQFMDPQTIAQRYMDQFADGYGRVLEIACSELLRLCEESTKRLFAQIGRHEEGTNAGRFGQNQRATSQGIGAYATDRQME